MTHDPIALLQDKLAEFSRERDWDRFHRPKNLVMALSVEVSELMEHFQWEASSADYAAKPPEVKQAVKEEVADVFLYLLRFCMATNIDPVAAAHEKMQKNALKYPADADNNPLESKH